MAGITFIYQQDGFSTSFLKKIDSVIGNTPEVKLLESDKKFILLNKSYEKYPIHLIGNEEYLLIIEGLVYDVDVSNDPIFKTQLRNLLQNQKKAESLNYIRNLDGEFIIYLFNKLTGEITIVNDFLGRLPVYYIQKDQFIFSRDISIVQMLTNGLAFDKQGIYEYIRLGYPLGHKTLFKNLYRLKPSSYIEFAEKIIIKNESISLENYKEDGKPYEHCIESLYELFKGAVRNRLKSSEAPMLSLSGGLDSRIIMGEIEKERQSVAYHSFLYKNAIIESDVAIVKKFCSFYKTQFGLTELEDWSPEYFDELSNAKYGMNYLGMAFIIQYLKKMSERYDLMLTGDGGDKTLAYLFPEKSMFFSDQAKVILTNNEICTKDVCSHLFKFDADTREKEMTDYLNSYGYTDTKLNYKHFLIHERTINWLFEGEDRNRNYIWSTSPFYHPGFFKMIHRFNENDKKDYSLYRSFTKMIEPELNDIKNANWGFSINEPKKLKYLFFKQAVKQQIRSLAPSFRNKHQEHGDLLLAVKDQLSGAFSEKLYLNKNLDFNRLNQEALFHILTLLKVADTLES